MKALKLKFSFLHLLIAAAVLVLLANSGFRSLVKNYREYRKLNSEKARLEAQRLDLQKQLKEVSASPAIEQAARKELSMLKPGETEYRFPPPKDSDK